MTTLVITFSEADNQTIDDIVQMLYMMLSYMVDNVTVSVDGKVQVSHQ